MNNINNIYSKNLFTANKQIGRIGIDEITISGFDLPVDSFEHPVAKDVLSKFGTPGYDYDSIPDLSQSSICVRFSKRFFSLKIGNRPDAKTHRAYVSLTLRSYRNGDNLENLDEAATRQLFDTVLSIIAHEYGIRLSFRFENLTITKIEINKTFRCPFGLEDIRDVLEIVSCSNATKKSKNANVLQGKNQDLQTVYLVGKDTVRIKLYNKSLELKEKNCTGYPNDMMRFEIRTNGQNIRYHFPGQDPRDTNLRFINLSDEGISNAYNYHVEEIFKKGEEHMKNLFPEKSDCEKYLLQCFANMVSNQFETNQIQLFKNLLEPVTQSSDKFIRLIDVEYLFDAFEQYNLLEPSRLSKLRKCYNTAAENDAAGVLEKYIHRKEVFRDVKGILSSENREFVERSA